MKITLHLYIYKYKNTAFICIKRIVFIVKHATRPCTISVSGHPLSQDICSFLNHKISCIKKNH